MYIYTDNFVSSLISVLRMAQDLSTNDIYDLFVVSETCLVHHHLMVLKSDTVTEGFFWQIWEGALGPFRTTKLGNFLNKK